MKIANAVVLPMTMTDSMMVMAIVTAIAFMGMSHPGLTYASQLLKGRPPSRAKDQSCRELVVTLLTAQATSSTKMMEVRASVARLDWVALSKISTYG